MKHFYLTLISFGLSFPFLCAQEVTIDREFGDNLILMDAGTGFTTNKIRFDNSESGGLSFLQYRFEFEQTNMGQIWDEWRVGLAAFGPSPEDFGIGRYNLVQDFVVFTPSLVITRDNNFAGINSFNPQARFHIEHLDNNNFDGQQAGLLLGETTQSSYGYLTVNKPEDDINANIARFRDDGSTQVWINKAANTYQLEVFGDAKITGVWTTSDTRLKKDIQPIEDALVKLRKVQASSYVYDHAREGFHYLPKTKQMGLLSDNVKEIFPSLVKESEHLNEDGTSLGNFESVNYPAMIPVLIKSIQELDDKISSLESANDKLKTQNESLMAKLDALLKE